MSTSINDRNRATTPEIASTHELERATGGSEKAMVTLAKIGLEAVAALKQRLSANPPIAYREKWATHISAIDHIAAGVDLERHQAGLELFLFGRK
jgi:hypothetical protein